MRKTYLILIAILLIGLFFRTYQATERFEFAHDGDLYSWIVKDIAIDHHVRLIGQLTSAPGIFIGGLFYYLLIPFFLLSKMDPIGTIYFSVIVGLLTITSFCLVLTRLFKKEVGLIGAYLYATLLATVNVDRWVVPTITTNLWVVWYLYCVISIVRGNYRILPLLGILIGLIWHVHIALLPVLIAIPVSVVLAKKLPNKKQLLVFFVVLLLSSLPFILFEIKHNFQQINAFLINFQTPREGPAGLHKFAKVLNMITGNINGLLFAPQSFKLTSNIFFVLIILLSSFWLIRKKILSKKELAVFITWILGVVFFFSFSSSPISEYYFSNIGIIFLSLVSLNFYLFYKSSKIGKILIIGLLALVGLKNGYFIITQSYYHKGYLEKKAVVDYINQDSKNKGYPCVGITYITSPGENVGFRYFFYLKNTHLIHPSLDIPVYNIVIPDELSLTEVKLKFGHIGIIPPTKIPTKEVIDKSCQTPNTNTTDSLFGYVD